MCKSQKTSANRYPCGLPFADVVSDGVLCLIQFFNSDRKTFADGCSENSTYDKLNGRIDSCRRRNNDMEYIGKSAEGRRLFRRKGGVHEEQRQCAEEQNRVQQRTGYTCNEV